MPSDVVESISSTFRFSLIDHLRPFTTIFDHFRSSTTINGSRVHEEQLLWRLFIKKGKKKKSCVEGAWDSRRRLQGETLTVRASPGREAAFC